MAQPPQEQATLYVDLMSQPSRACWAFCKMHDLPVEIKLLRLDKGEHRSPWYQQLNPLGKVPFLVDGDLRLPESAAILSYLSSRHQLPPPWGREEGGGGGGAAARQRQAARDAALHWQHLTVRLGCTRLVFNTVVGPRVFKVPASPALAEHGRQVLQQALRDLESYWLDGGRRRFMAGTEPSPADLLCCCELEQLRLLAGDPGAPQMEQLLSPHPAVRSWMAAVREAVGARGYDEAHATLRAAEARFAGARGGGGAGSGGGGGGAAAPRL